MWGLNGGRMKFWNLYWWPLIVCTWSWQWVNEARKKLTRKKKGTLSFVRPSSAKSQLRGRKKSSSVLYDLDTWINCSGKLTNREKVWKQIDSRRLREFDACYMKGRWNC